MGGQTKDRTQTLKVRIKKIEGQGLPCHNIPEKQTKINSKRTNQTTVRRVFYLRMILYLYARFICGWLWGRAEAVADVGGEVEPQLRPVREVRVHALLRRRGGACVRRWDREIKAMVKCQERSVAKSRRRE